MNEGRIEHVNITVSNPEKTASLLCELFDWKIRWQGPSQMGGRTIHVGTDNDYLAVYSHLDSGTDEQFHQQATRKHGVHLNHVGIEVPNLDATEQKVVAAGFRPINHADYEPGRRFYFNDHDGVEYEIVEYTK